ncbi:MAG: hypothetical protein ABIG63_09075, partial [Chloroflexota bacterium]
WTRCGGGRICRSRPMNDQANQILEGTGKTSRWRRRLRELPGRIRRWALEDRAGDGLGGPPNNWRASPKVDGGHGCAYKLRFCNDGHEMGIAIYDLADGMSSSWLGIVPIRAFRPLVWWYIWRWAWGEWFGLRRKLFYRHLHRQALRESWVLPPRPQQQIYGDKKEEQWNLMESGSRLDDMS